MTFDEDFLDGLQEWINIGTGRAAASLSDMLEARIELRVPSLKIIDLNQEELPPGTFCPDDTAVVQGFTGQLNGRAGLVFPPQSAIQLAQLLNGDDTPVEDLDIELSGIILETGNIVLNGIMGTFANVAETNLQYTVPELANFNVQRLLPGSVPEPQVLEETNDDARYLLLADAQFRVADSNITGSILIVFKIGCLQQLFKLMDAA